jgi:hypothetical protein
MGAEAASIFHRKGDKDTRASMDRSNGACGSTVCRKLAVLGLFRNKAGDSRGVLEDSVAVDGGHPCSTTRWRTSAKKSKTTTSPGLEASAALRPLAHVTTSIFGTPISLSI